MVVSTIWREEMTVQSSETDFQKRLKWSNVFLRLQDIASNHASHLGFGYADMLTQDTAWVLSRIKVRFHDFPQMGEKVNLQTWPKGVQQKIFFMRDYFMSSPDGRRYAEATSAYVVMNASTRRIVMPQMLTFPLPDNDGLSAIDEPLEKIQAVEALSECFTLQIGYSAVDVMEHVNNARYVEWISDCFSIAEHQERRLDWIQVNFLNEVLPGEKVTLLRGNHSSDPKAWYITAVNQSTGSKPFEAEVHWD
jgi:acyl-ACP thioesterase